MEWVRDRKGVAYPARCMGCGANQKTPYSLQRDWVRADPDTPIYFLCPVCHEDLPTVEWNPDGSPRSVTFSLNG